MCHGILLAEASHSIYLILHQSDERRDDYRCSLHQKSWELVA